MLKYLKKEGKWMLINNVNIISVYFLAIISVLLRKVHSYFCFGSVLHFSRISPTTSTNTFYAQLNSKHSLVFQYIVQWYIQSHDLPQRTAITFIENVAM